MEEGTQNGTIWAATVLRPSSSSRDPDPVSVKKTFPGHTK